MGGCIGCSVVLPLMDARHAGGGAGTESGQPLLSIRVFPFWTNSPDISASTLGVRYWLKRENHKLNQLELFGNICLLAILLRHNWQIGSNGDLFSRLSWSLRVGCWHPVITHFQI